jgi:threonine/homoserine/homoserine lactone efflux protein
MVAGYAKLRRWFEALFAVAFGLAGLKILTARLD